MEEKQKLKEKIGDLKDLSVFIKSKGGEQFLEGVVNSLSGNIIRLTAVKASDTDAVMAIVSDIKADLRVLLKFNQTDNQLEQLQDVLSKLK